MKIKIGTPYGDYYTVNENGEITRDDMPGMKPSKDWQLLGIEHVKRNYFIPFKNLTEWISADPILKWKNGSPQFTARDLDHGTVRAWGNTQYHGIAHLWVEG